MFEAAPSRKGPQHGGLTNADCTRTLPRACTTVLAPHTWMASRARLCRQILPVLPWVFSNPKP